MQTPARRSPTGRSRVSCSSGTARARCVRRTACRAPGGAPADDRRVWTRPHSSSSCAAASSARPRRGSGAPRSRTRRSRSTSCPACAPYRASPPTSTCVPRTRSGALPFPARVLLFTVHRSLFTVLAVLNCCVHGLVYNTCIVHVRVYCRNDPSAEGARAVDGPAVVELRVAVPAADAAAHHCARALPEAEAGARTPDLVLLHGLRPPLADPLHGTAPCCPPALPLPLPAYVTKELTFTNTRISSSSTFYCTVQYIILYLYYTYCTFCTRILIQITVQFINQCVPSYL